MFNINTISILGIGGWGMGDGIEGEVLPGMSISQIWRIVSALHISVEIALEDVDRCVCYVPDFFWKFIEDLHTSTTECLFSNCL